MKDSGVFLKFQIFFHLANIFLSAVDIKTPGLLLHVFCQRPVVRGMVFLYLWLDYG